MIAPEGALSVDGFDDALIGTMERYGMYPILVLAYDWDKCVAILMERDGMDREEAIDYMNFNVTAGWVGDGTPCFIHVYEDE
jgi:hypothetical protein